MGKRFCRLAGVAGALMLAAGAAQATTDDSQNDAFAQTCAAAARDSAVGGPWDASRVATCTKAIETEPLGDKAMAATHINRGILRAALKDYKWAISDFGSAIALAPDVAEGYLNRAWAEIALKQYAKALPDLDKALALGPKDPSRAYYNRGVVNEELGNPKAAYNDYVKAARLSPTWTAPRTELARFKVVNR